MLEINLKPHQTSNLNPEKILTSNLKPANLKPQVSQTFEIRIFFMIKCLVV